MTALKTELQRAMLRRGSRFLQEIEMIDAEYVKRLATQTTLDLWPGWVHEGRSLENLVSFAREVAKAEREACAEVCAAVREQDARGGNDSYFEGRQMGATVCMNGIRRRSFRDDGDVWVKSADREPLSTEEACALLKDALGIDPIIDGNLLKMLRSVEQAHGIGGGLCTLAANPTKS